MPKNQNWLTQSLSGGVTWSTIELPAGQLIKILLDTKILMILTILVLGTEKQNAQTFLPFGCVPALLSICMRE